MNTTTNKTAMISSIKQQVKNMNSLRIEMIKEIQRGNGKKGKTDLLLCSVD